VDNPTALPSAILERKQGILPPVSFREGWADEQQQEGRGKKEGSFHRRISNYSLHKRHRFL